MRLKRLLCRLGLHSREEGPIKWGGFGERIAEWYGDCRWCGK